MASSLRGPTAEEFSLLGSTSVRRYKREVILGLIEPFQLSVRFGKANRMLIMAHVAGGMKEVRKFFPRWPDSREIPEHIRYPAFHEGSARGLIDPTARSIYIGLGLRPIVQQPIPPYSRPIVQQPISPYIGVGLKRPIADIDPSADGGASDSAAARARSRQQLEQQLRSSLCSSSSSSQKEEEQQKEEAPTHCSIGVQTNESRV